MKVFRVVLSTQRTDVEVVQDVCGFRWKVEQFHRETKQLTGLESCQCGDGSRPDPASVRSSGVCHQAGPGCGPTLDLFSLVIFPTKRFGNTVPGMLAHRVSKDRFNQ